MHSVQITLKPSSPTPQIKNVTAKLSRARKARIRLRQLHRRRSQETGRKY